MGVKQQFAGRHMAPIGHIILNQTLFLLLNAVCLVEKQQISIRSVLG